MNSYEYQKSRGLKRKFFLISERGGECEECGYKKNLAAFDFHHINPKEKEFKLDMRNLSNRSMKKIMVEFDKCLILCSNCHREEHFPDLVIDKVKILVEELNNNILSIREIKKPHCLDCDVEINYTSKRCIECERKRKSKERPDMSLLMIQYNERGGTWCSKEHNVSRTTIRRWLQKL